MTALETTISMLEVMPEVDLLKIQQLIKNVLIKKEISNPFVCLSKEETLSQLATARQEARNGEAQDAMKVYDEIVKKYGL